MANLLSNTTIGGYQSIHTGNVGSYAMSSSGGTLSGTLTIGTTGSTSQASALRVVRTGSNPSSFGSYSGSWRSAIEIWDNQANTMLFLASPDGSTYNYSIIKSVGAGLVIDVGSAGATNAITISTAGVVNAPQGLQVGGNSVVSTAGGQTIAGTTYFSGGESLNVYGIRGRFTNEYMHLYNKVGIGHPSGWGQGEGNTPSYGLSTYGGANFAYGNNADSTFNGIVYSTASFRAPIFYDSNNTNYFGDFAGTSNLNVLYTNYLYIDGTQLTGTQTQQLKNTLDITGLPYKCDIVINGDPNTFYPVHFIWGNQDVWRRIIINRGYAEQAPWDPVGSGVHHGGLLIDWEGNFGGWGGAEYSDRLRVFNYSYTDSCADMYIYTHSMGYVFMLRGGGTTGALYHIYSDQEIRGYNQVGTPDIAYSTSTKFYDAGPSYPQYDVYAPAPLTLAQVNSSRIDGLRTKKQSLLDSRYFRQGVDISGITNVTSTNFLASNAYYLNGTSYYLNSYNGGIYTNVRFQSAGDIQGVGFYTSDWFRNNNSHQGLYNQANGNHFYSRATTQWAMGFGGNTNGSLQFYQSHENTIEGQVYYDGAGFGILNRAAQWAVRSARDSTNVALFYSGAAKLTTGPEGIVVSNSAGNGLIQLTSAGSCVVDILNAQSEAYLRTTSYHDLHFRTNNVNRMMISKDGNVGIGTTSPGYKLDVNGIGNFSNGFSDPSSETGYRLKFYDNGGIYNDAGIGLDGSGGGNEIMWFNALGGFYWGLGTGGTKMKLDSSGNLGIGNTSPNDKLDVSGNVSANAFNAVGTLARYNGTGGVAIAGLGGSSYAYIKAYSNSGGTGKNLALQQDGGNVGIGTTSPSVPLQVGTVSIGASGGSPSVIASNGLTVGSGSILSLDHNYYVHGYIQYDPTTFGVNSRLGIFGHYGISFGTNQGNGALVIRGDSNNVGIGSTSPLGKLTVVGNGTTNTYGGTLRVVNTDTTNSWGSIGLPGDEATQSTSNNYYLIGRGSSIASRIMSFHIPTSSNYGGGSEPKFGFYSSGSDLLHSIEANTGTAYFKGALTASSLIKSGGTSWQYLKGDGSVTTVNATSDFVRYGDYINQPTFANKTITLNPSVIKTLLWGGNNIRYTVTDVYTGSYPAAGSTWVKTYELIDGTNSVYSGGNIYLGFWVNRPPANITVRVQNTSGVWTGPYSGTEIRAGGSCVDCFAYWKVPCGGPNYIKKWEITLTPQDGYTINLQTVDIVIDNSEGIDQVPFVSRNGSSIYGTLSFIGSGPATNAYITNGGVIGGLVLKVANNTGILEFQSSGGTKAGSMFMDGSIWRLKSSNSTDTLNIFANGNLGIKQTTDAGYTFDVNGTARFSGAIVMNGTQQIKQQGYAGIEYYNAGAQWQGYIGTENNTGNLRYNSYSGSHTWYANSVQKMFLSSSGNLGIGTPTPGYKLHVYESNTAESVSAKFQTSHPNLNYILLQNGGGAYNHYLQTNSNSLALSADENGSNGIIYLKTNNTTALTITSSQNVGIGTSSPSRKLHVNGDVQVDTNLVVSSGIYNTNYYAGSATATYFKNSVGTDTLTILQSGNVGIGTTQPVGQLNVFGGTGNNPAILTLQSQSGGGGNTGIYFRPYQNVTFANTAPAQATILAVDASYSAHITFSTKIPGSGSNALVERMRLSATGSLMIGSTTDTGEALQVTGSIKSTALSTNGPVVSSGGVLNSVNGYTGMVTIQQPAPMPPITFDIQNGIIVNVMM